MSSPGSVTGWIGQLKTGEAEAARQLWQRYFPRLVGLARQKLHGSLRAVADEEDVALSAFDTFCRKVMTEAFPEPLDRDSLWGLLVTITSRKAADLVKWHTRTKRRGPHASGPEAIPESVPSNGPTPELWVQVAEQCQDLLAMLPSDDLRAVALWKLEDCGNAEIAGRLGCSLRSVERKLWVIRNFWSRTLSL